MSEINTIAPLDLFEKVAALIEESRKRVATAVNTEMVYTHYEIGRYIVEDEQNGEARAKYGKKVLKMLSSYLISKYGRGWSVESLTQSRKFYLTYSKIVNSDYEIQISNTPEKNRKQCLQNSTIVAPKFILSWSHYLILMRIENPQERRFYEIECARQNWNSRYLQRQYASSLYERLALSRDKDQVLRLAQEGQTIEKPEDIIKNPLTLEFVGLKPEAAYTESTLETAIIDKLQMFLMEMGRGFLFEARQKRFTFDEDNYYVDLVLYNRLLQCYVLVDLKIDKLTHQDLGQMQMYVNYYDRHVIEPFEKPTIGILLCKEKNDALVELTLPKDAHIYAQQYKLCLPDKALLEEKLREWIAEFDEVQE